MLELKAVAPKSKPVTDGLLTGQAIELSNNACRCGSLVAVIDADRQLHCRSCGRQRGFLTAFTADWISKVIVTFGGAESIIVRVPPAPRRKRGKPQGGPDVYL
jgi:hypothetical protein